MLSAGLVSQRRRQRPGAARGGRRRDQHLGHHPGAPALPHPGRPEPVRRPLARPTSCSSWADGGDDDDRRPTTARTPAAGSRRRPPPPARRRVAGERAPTPPRRARRRRRRRRRRRARRARLSRRGRPAGTRPSRPPRPAAGRRAPRADGAGLAAGGARRAARASRWSAPARPRRAGPPGRRRSTPRAAQAVRAARSTAATVLSYDYRHLDADFAAGRALTTGAVPRPVREDHRRRGEAGGHPDQGDRASPQVASTGVVRASGRRGRGACSSSNQTTTSNRLERPQVDQNRVEMTMIQRRRPLAGLAGQRPVAAVRTSGRGAPGAAAVLTRAAGRVILMAHRCRGRQQPRGLGSER